jgi:hypothetical protein
MSLPENNLPKLWQVLCLCHQTSNNRQFAILPIP